MLEQNRNEWDFIPKPQHKRISLYPQRGYLENYDENKNYSCALKEFLLDKINCNEKEIEFFSSGSEAIIFAIKMLNLETKIVVGIPYFFCHSFLRVLEANEIPYEFYHLNEELNFDENSYNEIINKNCNFVILPHLFSNRNFEAYIDRMINVGMYCLVDACQTYNSLFGNTLISHERVLYVLSFGHSKPSQSSGGGALIFNLNSKEVSQLKKRLEFTTFSTIDKSFISYIDFLKYEYAESKKTFSNQFSSISNENAAEAYIHLSKLVNPNTEENYKNIKEKLIQLLGIDSLKYIGNNTTPSILAIQSTITSRYAFGCELSKLGVETTWYYPPVFHKDRILHVSDISEKVLILPFSLFHCDENMRLLLELLEKSVENIRCLK